MLRKAKREAILKILEETYKDTKTALNYNSPFELLVAVVLSAQCTDERVNKITARIFPRLNTPEKMGALTQEQMEQEIRDCGLFHAKAKNLLATCKMLVEEFNSTVPDNIEDLMKLPGVGKKTAERLVVELKDKVATLGITGTAATSVQEAQAEAQTSPVCEEAVAALVMLGFSPAPTTKVVKAILKDSPTYRVEEVIKVALKML